MNYPEFPIPGALEHGVVRKRLTMDEYAEFVLFGLRTIPDIEKARKGRPQAPPRKPFVAHHEAPECSTKTR